MRKAKRIGKRLLIAFFILIAIGFMLPHPKHMPVQGATNADYHPDSFWYYPWGKSVTHKGVDIFAKTGTRVNSATPGLVLFAGKFSMGGNVILILGPKWRVHYYAHLNSSKARTLSFVSTGQQIGIVGDSGNAKGKAPHLHYSISSLIPLPWRIDDSPQGLRKAFYLNPIDFIQNSSN